MNVVVDANDTKTETLVSKLPLDISFIPSSLRETARNELRDQLVVVGKDSRKRKRGLANDTTRKSRTVARNANDGTLKDDDLEGANPEAFDYDKAENILDVSTGVEKTHLNRKPKKRKGA